MVRACRLALVVIAATGIAAGCAKDAPRASTADSPAASAEPAVSRSASSPAPAQDPSAPAAPPTATHDPSTRASASAAPPAASNSPPQAADSSASDATSQTAPPSLTGDSTLGEWRRATPAARSHVAVALARSRLAPDASKLDVAKLAMEITGCVSATAKDTRLDGWKVSPTATTCLTAPEREKRE